LLAWGATDGDGPQSGHAKLVDGHISDVPNRTFQTFLLAHKGAREQQATMASRLRGIAVVGAVVASGLAVVRGGPVNTLPMAYSGALPGDDQVLWAVVWGPTHPKKNDARFDSAQLN
jgi:hypothetical protein